MKCHHLKCAPVFFEALCSGAKTFEFRKNDRGFEVGDVLKLEEYDENDGHTGRSVFRSVTFILSGYPGIDKGFCILGLSCR